MIAITRKKITTPAPLESTFDCFKTSCETRAPKSSDWNPLTDIIEDTNGFKILLEIPGIRVSDIKIEASKTQLIVYGMKGKEFGHTNEAYSRQERGYGKFQRTIQFPAPIDPECICTDYQNGIFTVFLPKVQASIPKSIKIVFDN